MIKYSLSLKNLNLKKCFKRFKRLNFNSLICLAFLLSYAQTLYLFSSIVYASQ